jgi:lipopolysaccharide export system protein LptA
MRRLLPLAFFPLAFLWVVAMPFGAQAQDQSADTGFDFGGSQPIEISADNGIEWNRDAKTYTARGNAVATQGT